ncbi:class I SAM-dependent methyltransferase [Motilimonas sp. 1_MG-2023]|uniref:class I SAM-dependent methyltransferase n=1 Tax=Motilimonas sp. 1_MG-2023 TaxID=3062672 RepID=UPI0026E20767|nr:class I SAM-dependent methyltransferase [Motilimonas sp. 1_MG-2023]MDO6525499.1 class I SAM-dependent methyltransferase [Motilimonas sp. 1_MG-2023]
MPLTVTLAKGKEKSLLRRHPWIFSGAIKSTQGKALSGETVDIVDAHGNWLAKAAWSDSSQIRARVWSFEPNESIDLAFFINKIKQAQTLRDDLIAEKGLTGYRLIAGEADGLPGITIDRYNNVMVCQLLSAGAEFQKPAIIGALQALYPDCAVYERSDVAVRKKEGLALTQGLLAGTMPEGDIVISENNGVKIKVDIVNGHKTGFYLDQRDNRAIAAKYVKDKTVLNCFCYTGTFGVYALKGGAKHVQNVDVSDLALATAKENAQLNQLDLSKAEFINEDVFSLLRRYRNEGRTFDTIILDPPKFAENKSQVVKACRGYKDINMIAMQLLNEGGTLLTFSCSGLISGELFQKVVADAAVDAGKDAYIVERMSQAGDHPVKTNYPEGFYLKGLVVKVY